MESAMSVMFADTFTDHGFTRLLRIAISFWEHLSGARCRARAAYPRDQGAFGGICGDAACVPACRRPPAADHVRRAPAAPNVAVYAVIGGPFSGSPQLGGSPRARM